MAVTCCRFCIFWTIRFRTTRAVPHHRRGISDRSDMSPLLRLGSPAAVWQLVFLLKPPGSDGDIHRYVWDGRVQRLGDNPYIAVPSYPVLAWLHAPESRSLNDARSAPPLPQHRAALPAARSPYTKPWAG